MLWAVGRGRSLWQLPLAVFLCSLLAKAADDEGVASPGESTSDAISLDGLPPEKLGLVLALNLQTEDQRASEPLLRLEEFQDLADLDCKSRLLYLLNQTLNLRDTVRAYHDTVFGIVGLFAKVLQETPEENTWLWLLTNAHDRTMQQVQTYWSKVVALAMDQHQCMVSDVRNMLLNAVVGWKNLHAKLLSLVWNGFAFGSYLHPSAGSTAGEAQRILHIDREVLHADAGRSKPQLLDSILEGTSWITILLDWVDAYTRDLYGCLVRIEAANPAVEAEAAGGRLHQDERGSFVVYEFLRRKVFGQWAIDKGLVRGLLRYVWQPPQGDEEPSFSVADFGAGGGHYSTWLNETGLVKAFAFDGTRGAAEITKGLVQEINLVEETVLWRDFDWVLCLEVGEHIPQQFASTLLRNLQRHARSGIVMSWSDDWEGIGHVNCLPRDEFVSIVENETGFLLDAGATDAIKASCEIDYIARTIAVFRAPNNG